MHPFKLMVDQTDLGNPIVEHLMDLGIDVEGVTLTDRTKEELLSNLKILMEENCLTKADVSRYILIGASTHLTNYF